MDGSPVTWSRYPAPYDLGTVEIADGSLVITPSTEYPRYPTINPNLFETDLVVQDRLFHDVNVHTQFRALGPGSATAGVAVLDTYYTSALQGSIIWGGLEPSGDLTIWYEQNGNPNVLRSLASGLSMRGSDVQLCLVIDGEYVRLSAWPADGLEEAAPQISSRLPTLFRPQDHEGRATIWASSLGTPVPVAFRFVNVVPEPSSWVLAGLGILGLTLRRRRARM